MAYKSNVVEASKELSAKEKIMVKDLNDAIKLADDECNGLLIEPAFHASIEVHNDKSDNQDYSVFVIVAKDGQKYYTSSESFINAYLDIWSEMKGENEEWAIKVVNKPSKNYTGRSFLTCVIV